MKKSQSEGKKKALNVLIDKLSECDDYREQKKIHYTLGEILYLSFCGSVCGCESYEEIADFGRLKIDWLRNYLPYKNGIPSHDTIGRVLSILNSRQLEKALVDFTNYQLELPDGALISIDGKRISRSATKKEQQLKKSEGGKQAINMVNVCCNELNSCLSSIRVMSKSVEHHVIEDILSLLDLSDCLITLDAGYCYKHVAAQIIGAQANYLIGLKANQPNLLASAKELLAEVPQEKQHRDIEQKSHGRLEQRSCKVVNIKDATEALQSKHKVLFAKWIGLKSFVEVTSHRTVIASNKKSVETRYYITSEKLSTIKANEVVRDHWAIENSLHWILDAAMGEDRSTKRTGNSAANFSIIRKLAYNKLKAFDDQKVSIKRRMRKCMLSEKYLENTLEYP